MSLRSDCATQGCGHAAESHYEDVSNRVRYACNVAFCACRAYRAPTKSSTFSLACEDYDDEEE